MLGFEYSNLDPCGTKVAVFNSRDVLEKTREQNKNNEIWNYDYCGQYLCNFSKKKITAGGGKYYPMEWNDDEGTPRKKVRRVCSISHDGPHDGFQKKLKTAPVPSRFFNIDRKLIRCIIRKHWYDGLSIENDFGIDYLHLAPFI